MDGVDGWIVDGRSSRGSPILRAEGIAEPSPQDLPAPRPPPPLLCGGQGGVGRAVELLADLAEVAVDIEDDVEGAEEEDGGEETEKQSEDGHEKGRPCLATGAEGIAAESASEKEEPAGDFKDGADEAYNGASKHESRGLWV